MEREEYTNILVDEETPKKWKWVNKRIVFSLSFFQSINQEGKAERSTLEFSSRSPRKHSL